jgi:hypothetical protein
VLFLQTKRLLPKEQPVRRLMFLYFLRPTGVIGVGEVGMRPMPDGIWTRAPPASGTCPVWLPMVVVFETGVMTTDSGFV